MKKIYLLFITSFVISCSGCTTMREPDTQGDSSLAVADKSSEQVESAQASAELASAATLVSASDMSGVESNQSMLDSESANAIADSNIDNSTIKQEQ